MTSNITSKQFSFKELFFQLSVPEKIALACVGIGIIILVINSSLKLAKREEWSNAASNDDSFILESSPTSPEPNNSGSVNSDSIWIDIGGAVAEPGLKEIVYTSGEKPRLNLAIEAAGGWDNQANFTYINKTLNLAREIQDGEKIYIPYEYEEIELSSSSKSVSDNKTSTETISLNNASEIELQQLIGVGEVRATNIVQNRPFSSLEEAVSMKVITQKIINDNLELLVL